VRSAWTRRGAAPSTRRHRGRALATSAAALALVAPLSLLTAGTAAAEAHVDNPFVGATQYVNPQWKAAVEAEAAKQSDAALAQKMRWIANQPTAVWMDRISAIAGNADGNGLKYHLDNAVAQKGSGPIVFNVVIYDLPGRDCHALASNGELPASDEGLARYKSEYIDPIAALFSDPKYANIRIVATIEPDSLPNITTNSSEAACAAAGPYYRAGVKYALDKLHAIPNVYNYVDLAHSGWLGWDSNSGPAAQLMAEVAKSTTAGFASIDGFITDTANTTPLEEPFLTNPDLSVGGQPVKSAKFYEWNGLFDETDFTAAMYTKLVAAGFPSSIGMVVDTSRNGWGGPNRPTKVSTSTNLDTYVNESRVDRRTHRGAWCNPDGAGIGERPKAAPGPAHIDAYVWVKPPGESDGASTEIPNDQGKRLDRMCDPTYSSSALGGATTGALAGAPLSGQWFAAQFKQLVTNAYPVITSADEKPDPGTPGGGDPDPVDTQAPSAPTGVRAGTATTSSIPVSWTASTDNVAVTGYTVLVDGTAVGTTTSTSYTITGLTAGTRYSITVTARDAAGNVSTPSTAITASTTTTGGTTDTQAPTVPTGLTAGTATTTSVPVSWTASSDNVAVTGYAVSVNGTVVGNVTGTSYTITGLAANTSYTVTVAARDAAGNTSAASAPLAVKTAADTTTPVGACTATYKTVNSWSGGYQGEITVKAGTSAITTWKVTAPAGLSTSNVWGGKLASGVFTPEAWNATLAAGATTTIGFIGNGTAPAGGSLTCS
jgi:cellulose 1,4-beta-cellobiosidase